MGSPSTNFDISGTFPSWLTGKQLSEDHLTLWPWPLTLEVMALVDDTGLRGPSVWFVLVTLTFDLVTLKLMHFIAREVGNLAIQFWCFWEFRFSMYRRGQHLSDASRDLATFTFDLEGHGACRWCMSSCSICESRLNFVGLPVRKKWLTFGFSISPSRYLDLWPLTSKRVQVIALGMVKYLSINFRVSGTFNSRFIGQHLSDAWDASRDFATLTFDLGGRGAFDDAGLRAPVVYQVWSS